MAKDPDKEPPSYEDVGLIIDERDNRNKHIIYPMAGALWNQIDWQIERNINQYIKSKFSEVVSISPLINPYSKRITLLDETERMIFYNKRSNEIECIDIGKPPILQCQKCGVFLTIDIKTCNCLEYPVFVDIDRMYYHYRVSDSANKIKIIRDIVPVWKR